MAGLLYFDHHATTPCDPRVVEAMIPYFTERFGNAASRSHLFGLQAKAAVDVAREQVAALLGAHPTEIVFTSGATEADNLAFLGLLDGDPSAHVVTTAIEHKAVLDPARHHAARGGAATIVPVDGTGRVDPQALAEAITPQTRVVSVMAANNEVGTLQPIDEIAQICRARGVWFHVDAAQIVGHLPFRADAADLVSVSAHKMYGPKGVGALWIRRRPKPPVRPILHGGGHERGLRPGTLPVPLLVGFGRAAEIAQDHLRCGGPERISALRDALHHGLNAIGGVHLNGHPVHRLPHNLNVSFDGVEAEALMLSTKGVAVSTGSACTSATLEPSHVLRGMGLPAERAHSAIRFGLGRGTTEEDVRAVVHLYADAVPRLRAMSPFAGESSRPDPVRTLRG